MADEPVTFGGYIAKTRKELGLSQKQLADMIGREEGGSISAPYLNDIEHGRRSPSSDYMIQQFAGALKVSANYLSYLAGRVPAPLRQAHLPPSRVDEWVAAYRRNNQPKRKG